MSTNSDLTMILEYVGPGKGPEAYQLWACRGEKKGCKKKQRKMKHCAEDLSFECDGVTCVVAPSRETYNRTFAVLRKIRDGVTIEVPK